MSRVTGLAFLFYFICTSNSFSQRPSIDIELLKPINKNETVFKNKYLELCASSVTALSIGIPAGIAIAGFITHDNKLKKDALYMAGGYVVSAVITHGIKYAVNRKRPFETYSYIVRRDNESRGLSFPSGHTSSAFCIATEVSLRYRKWYIIAPAYLYAGSVAWARMYQGVHYPSDVVIGAIIGTGSAWLSWKVQRWMQKKQDKKRTTQQL